ncbi:PID-CTERM protein-sorting domain-containing protein [Hymenobacter sp. B81]|uniref:PID-CTERM protein-sorting domain-containing protein n=1 Tax=Hymenobacter sp. B81 TaxID=3344878 RepID=UPI0037DDC14C
MNLRSFRIFLALLPLVALLSLTAAAQGNPGSGGPQPGQPTAVPIDGGASLLLAAGAAYGLRHLRQRRRA